MGKVHSLCTFHCKSDIRVSTSVFIIAKLIYTIPCESSPSGIWDNFSDLRFDTHIYSHKNGVVDLLFTSHFKIDIRVPTVAFIIVKFTYNISCVSSPLVICDNFSDLTSAHTFVIVLFCNHKELHFIWCKCISAFKDRTSRDTRLKPTTRTKCRVLQILIRKQLIQCM